jgi:V-type H+-transporting ATPase subunit D
MKNRLNSAKSGHDLLKRKTDALLVRFRQILKRIIETKVLMGEVMRSAALSLAEAKYTMGDFGQQILQDVEYASIRIVSKKENVVGKMYFIEFVILNNHWACFYLFSKLPIKNEGDIIA